MSNQYFLDAAQLKLRWRHDRLTLCVGEQEKKLAAPRRTLPLSQPERFILLLDEDGEELGCLSNLEDLEPQSAAALCSALRQAYVITTISRILEVDRNPLTGQVRWRVEVETEESEEAPDEEAEDPLEQDYQTPSGTVTSAPRRLVRALGLARRTTTPLPGLMEQGRQLDFVISGPEDVQTARYPHIYLHDIQGDRYQILNCEALDLESRRLAERFF